MNIYQPFVFTDKLISPVTGYSCKRITKQNIKQFGFDSIESLLMTFPEFPLSCDYWKEQLSNAGEAAKQKTLAQKEKRICEYDNSPNKCGQCGVNLPYTKRGNKFCSRSCSAIFNNALDSGSMSVESRNKISYKLTGRKYPERKKYSIVSFCTVCGSCIPNVTRVTCSSECWSKHISNLTIGRIKKNKRSNYRRDKRSYLEESFEHWLNLTIPNINYIPEHTIRNHITKKWYFVDFYFPDLNLIVELDGKQHEKPKHKEADNIRDSYVQTHLGLHVFRISHQEYRLGTKIQELLKLLKR